MVSMREPEVGRALLRRGHRGCGEGEGPSCEETRRPRGRADTAFRYALTLIIKLYVNVTLYRMLPLRGGGSGWNFGMGNAAAFQPVFLIGS